MAKHQACVFLLLLSIVFIRAPHSHGEVIVFDRITTIGKPIFLKALTRGRLFPQGGKLVNFHIDNNYIGRNLSGGDGYAYLKYLPREIGIKRIEARTDTHSSQGLLLVTKKNKEMILIEIVGGLRETILNNRALKYSKTAVKTLSDKYGIIYLSRKLMTAYMKKWLEQENFVQSPVLPWSGPELLTGLEENGLRLHALIGSAELLSEASEYIENRYSFQETEQGKTLEDWKEVLKLLGP